MTCYLNRTLCIGQDRTKGQLFLDLLDENYGLEIPTALSVEWEKDGELKVTLQDNYRELLEETLIEQIKAKMGEDIDNVFRRLNAELVASRPVSEDASR